LELDQTKLAAVPFGAASVTVGKKSEFWPTVYEMGILEVVDAYWRSTRTDYLLMKLLFTCYSKLYKATPRIEVLTGVFLRRGPEN
jgi:hypothetical protein